VGIGSKGEEEMPIGVVYAILEGIGIALLGMALGLKVEELRWWEFAVGAVCIIGILRTK
jgi:multidrug transporter EmrE-like cation transporter